MDETFATFIDYLTISPEAVWSWPVSQPMMMSLKELELELELES